MPGGLDLPPNGPQGAGGAWGAGLFPDWFEEQARSHAWDSITAANFFRNWVATNPQGPDGQPIDFGWYWNSFLPVDPATGQPGENYNAPQFTDNSHGHLYNGEDPNRTGAAQQPQVPPPAHMQQDQQQNQQQQEQNQQQQNQQNQQQQNQQNQQQQQVGGPRGVQVRNFQDMQALRQSRLNAWRQSRGLSSTSQNQYGQSVVNAPQRPPTPDGAPMPFPAPPNSGPLSNTPPGGRPPGTPGPWGGSPPVPGTPSTTNTQRPPGTPGPWGGSKPVGNPAPNTTDPPSSAASASQASSVANNPFSNSTRRRYGGLLA